MKEKTKICCRCEKKAEMQTVRDKKYSPQTWYCKKCWYEGERLENEAMYGKLDF